MVTDQQIIQKLKTIDQYGFESLVNNLLQQGAFPEVLNRNASVEPFGVNIEKERTRKSSPRSDTESIIGNIKVESSVQASWGSKLKEVVEKHKNQTINKFVFFTNQDTISKQISVDGKNMDADEYCRNGLGCQSCFVIGQQVLALQLQNPTFFYIRRNFLNISEDFFYSVDGYKNVLGQNSSLTCNTDQSEIDKYASILSNTLSFDPGQVILLHNDDYITLLHTIATWGAQRIRKESRHTMSQDLCFIKWPQNRVNLENVSISELNDDISTIVFIWGAHEISNLSEYLMFNKQKTMLVFVCKSAFKSDVENKLKNFGGAISIRDLYISEIDKREAGTDEREKHRQKIGTLVETVTELLLKYEALVYFYSPFYLNSSEKKNKIRNALQINQKQIDHLNELLLQNDLASITGRILWLKQPVIAKELFNDYLNNKTFNIDNLMTQLP
jgi:hypothetical protein